MNFESAMFKQQGQWQFDSTFRPPVSNHSCCREGTVPPRLPQEPLSHHRAEAARHVQDVCGRHRKDERHPQVEMIFGIGKPAVVSRWSMDHDFKISLLMEMRYRNDLEGHQKNT